MAVPYLSDRLALKGGTAINLFCTDQFPRLSVDLDFNYIGPLIDKLCSKKSQSLKQFCWIYVNAGNMNCTAIHGVMQVVKQFWFIKVLMGTKGRLRN